MATAKQFQVNTLSGGTLTTGLVSYWNMEGNSNDFYGSNNGTDTSVSYGTSYGKVGQGAYYNGSAYTNLPTYIFTALPVSFSFWANPASIGTFSDSYIITNRNGTLGGELFAIKFTQSSGTTWYLDVDTRNSGFTTYNYASNTFVIGSYMHFVVTISATTVSFYINGVAAGSSSLSSSDFFNSLAWRIGSFLDGSTGSFLNGDLDELGIWSKALSTNEITDLYNGGAGQTMLWGDTQSDSMMNADSRFATVAFTKRFVAALAATIMNAASRFTTLAGNLLILVRNVSVTMMNAASRLTMLAGTITKYVTALSVSMMNSASRLATLFGQQMQYIANLSVSMMNAVSRLVVLTTGNMKILVVNMMNAAGRFTTIYSQVSLYIRNLTVNMMYAVNRLTSFLVTIPGTWAFRAKNLTSWAFRSKNNTSWTFRTKNPPGAENIPSEPN